MVLTVSGPFTPEADKDKAVRLGSSVELVSLEVVELVLLEVVELVLLEVVELVLLDVVELVLLDVDELVPLDVVGFGFEAGVTTPTASEVLP